MSVSFDRAAEIFNRTRGIPHSVMEKIVESLKKELEESRLILDVAIGTGRFARPLKDAGFNVVGIDISKKMLQKAYETGSNNLVLGDACNLPFTDSTFDASISVSTLHLIKNWKSALQEITRVTKKSLFTVSRAPLDHEATPSHIYKELLKKYGHSYNHPGTGLWKLKDIIKPTQSHFVTSYKVNTNELIAFHAERAFSYQWDVPDDLHENAMKELKRIFARNKKHILVNVHVYKWNINAIKNWLKHTQNA